MDSWKQYIFSIIVTACICGVLTQILSESKCKSAMQLVCGTVLAIIILQPLSRVRVDALIPDSFGAENTVDRYIRAGERTAEIARAEYIKTACEAYILNRARALDENLQIQISLNKDLLPELAEIKGAYGPAEQTELQNILTTEFGIPKENQIWIWNQESNGS